MKKPGIRNGGLQYLSPGKRIIMKKDKEKVTKKAKADYIGQSIVDAFPYEIIDLCLADVINQLFDDAYKKIREQPSAKTLVVELKKIIKEINKIRTVCKIFNSIVKNSNTVTNKKIREGFRPLHFLKKIINDLSNPKKDTRDAEAYKAFDALIDILFDNKTKGVWWGRDFFKEKLLQQGRSAHIRIIDGSLKEWCSSDFEQIKATFRIEPPYDKINLVTELFVDLISLSPSDQLAFINCFLGEIIPDNPLQITLYKKFLLINVLNEYVSRLAYKDTKQSGEAECFSIAQRRLYQTRPIVSRSIRSQLEKIKEHLEGNIKKILNLKINCKISSVLKGRPC